MQNITQSIHRFAQAKQGAFALIYALTLLPILGGVGLAIDYRNAQAAQSELRDALDSALLSATRTYSLNTFEDDDVREQLSEDAGRAIFQQNLADATIEVSPADITFTFSEDNVSVRAVVTGQVDLIFGGLFGMNYLELGAGASAQGADRRRVEVVLALDNSGSMINNNRMVLMRAAAQDFVDFLFDNGEEDNLYVGIVPWTTSVNMSLDAPRNNWSDNPYNEIVPTHEGTGVDGWSTPTNSQMNTYLLMPSLFRDFTRRAGHRVTASPPSFPTGTNVATLGRDNTPQNGLEDQLLIGFDRNTGIYRDVSYSNTQNAQLLRNVTGNVGWRGCVRAADGERRVNGASVVTAPLTDAPPPGGALWAAWIIEAGVAYPNTGDFQFGCPAPMLGLSGDRRQVKQALEKMRAGGGTYQDIGLSWALRMLSPRSEWTSLFRYSSQNAPKPFDNTRTRKVIVLLTDGQNSAQASAEEYYGCDTSVGQASDNQQTSAGAWVQRNGAGGCWRSPTVHRVNNTTLDNLTLDACLALRNTYQIELYTIAVDVTNAAALSLLDRCAGGPNSPRFENITGSQIGSVLLNIAEDSLRLTE